MVRIRTLFILVAFLAALAQTAGAEDRKTAADKPQYRQVTGDVVSLNASSIVVKSRSKGDVSLVITNRTNMKDAKALKAGDRARVHYREDRKARTATRIVKLAARPPAAPAAGR